MIVDRPRSCPTSLLAYFLAVFTVEIAYILNHHVYATARIGVYYTSAGAALAACGIILMMPLRGPSLPCLDIGVVGHTPSSNYRSPEDNLRLWQFLTVSWMSPLMSMGKKRQLHEEDVWSLGFEFQHRRLHDHFRVLRGSVISRLLQANGLDVLITATIAIVQMLCGMAFGPVDA